MRDRTASARRRISVRGGTLKISSAAGGTREIAIGDEPTLVGRDPKCALTIVDRHVSSVHAELVATERGVRVRDLGSRNGTWVGPLAVVEAYLADRCTLSFGNTVVRFVPDEPAPADVHRGAHFGALYGESAAMRQLFGRLARVAQTDLTALILGETGTGKELVAQALHAESARASRPFLVVDCGAIAPSLAESTLFGHEKGAFTGAASRRESPFVEADGGTVFLDELGELPLDVQPKLLRVLAEHRVQSIGGTGYRPFDVRIVAATRRDIATMVNDGTFRSDLYFRVAQVRIELPALRDRSEDIPGLVREILAQAGAPRGAEERIDPDTMLRLVRYDWPGNVRELRNAVSVAYALAAEDESIEVAAYLGATKAAGDSASAGVVTHGYHEAKREVLDRFERGYFAALAQECNGNIAEISRRAGLQRTHVRRYMSQHGLLRTRSKRVDDVEDPT